MQKGLSSSAAHPISQSCCTQGKTRSLAPMKVDENSSVDLLKKMSRRVIHSQKHPPTFKNQCEGQANERMIVSSAFEGDDAVFMFV